VHNQIIKVD